MCECFRFSMMSDSAELCGYKEGTRWRTECARESIAQLTEEWRQEITFIKLSIKDEDCDMIDEAQNQDKVDQKQSRHEV